METRSPVQSFLNLDKIVILKIILSPCLVDINDGDKIPIVDCHSFGKYFWWKQDPHCHFLNRDKIVILKIILSPCLVDINDEDKIPIVIFFEWGQDRKYTNHLVSMLSKYFWWRQDPHCYVFEWGQDSNFVNHFVSMLSKY